MGTQLIAAKTIKFLDLCWIDLAPRDTSEEPWRMQEPQEIECFNKEAVFKPQINFNIESFLLAFLFVFTNYFVSWDHRQTTLSHVLTTFNARNIEKPILKSS